MLVVTVLAPQWAAELARLEPEIVRRLSDRLGTGLVRSLRLIVAPPGDPAPP